VAERLRLMAVHAHPDDESSKGAATMARYVADGVDVMVVTCTGGERGDILNPALADDPFVAADIAAFRRGEMAEAARVLGVRHAWLGFVDSGLPEGDPLPDLPPGCFGLQDVTTAAEPLVALMRSFRPHVVTTYDENGGYPHPDHIMCHKVTVAAFEAAADPHAHPGTGAAWQPLKLYYDRTFTRAKVVAFHEALQAEGLESPFGDWLEHWPDGEQPLVTTRVTCGDFFHLRDEALKAHATQIDPDGPFFRLPIDLQRRIWPTEDFQLARSLIGVELPEDSLFAGVEQHLAVSAADAFARPVLTPEGAR